MVKPQHNCFRTMLVTLLAVTSGAALVFAAEPDGVMTLRLPEQTNPEVRKVQDQFYRLIQK